MSFARVLGVVAGLSVFAPSLGAQEPAPAEPWGYLYLFRTVHLYPLSHDENRIGRLVENELVLTSERVSRRHAVIRRGAEGIQILDVGSSNGTRVNGESLRPRVPAPLSPGDLVALADEPALFHVSLEELWRDELRHRFLAGLVKLNVALPQDRARKSFGREEVVPATTEARVESETGKVELRHSVELDSQDGFPEGSGAFIGHVDANEGVLELSLWTISGEQGMTSRRSSFSNLKHATLRVSLVEKAADGSEDGGRKGPWFPSAVLGGLLDLFADNPELSLQFASGLASQQRPLALRDAAATLAFRHRLQPDEWKLLVLAAQSKGLWVERELGERGLSLTDEDRQTFSAELEEARAWLQKARELGARKEAGDEAEAALVRASDRLTRLAGAPGGPP
jgi:pSer/pThr/pTyr-binding forkhead associated (FHA) protein